MSRKLPSDSIDHFLIGALCMLIGFFVGFFACILAIQVPLGY
jgi:hypothetical protein